MIRKLLIKSAFIGTWVLMAIFSLVSGHDNYIGMKACQINYEVEDCTKSVIWQPTEIKIAMGRLK